MSKVIEMNSGKAFEMPEEGTYEGVVVGVFDLGTQPAETDGKYPHPARPLVMHQIELVDSPQSDGSPTTLVKEVHLKMSSYLQGSTLFNTHKTLLGITTAELENSSKARELDAILGKPVIVSVGRTTGNKAKISGLSRVRAGQSVAKHQSELLFFDTDNPDTEVFNKLPTFVQNKIKKSLENPVVGSDDSEEAVALDM